MTTISAQQVASRLRRLAREFPRERYWLYVSDNAINIMRLNENGDQVMLANTGGVDPAYVVDSITGLPIDGGAW